MKLLSHKRATDPSNNPISGKKNFFLRNNFYTSAKKSSPHFEISANLLNNSQDKSDKIRSYVEKLHPLTNISAKDTLAQHKGAPRYGPLRFLFLAGCE